MGFAFWFGASSNDDTEKSADRKRDQLRLVDGGTMKDERPPVSPGLTAIAARIRDGDHAAFMSFMHAARAAEEAGVQGLVRNIAPIDVQARGHGFSVVHIHHIIKNPRM